MFLLPPALRAAPSTRPILTQDRLNYSPLPKRSCCWGSRAALRLRWGRGEEEDGYPQAALPGTRERPGKQLRGRHKRAVNIPAWHTPSCPCALRHVSSEESNGTEGGCSPPSTPGAPSPRRRQDRQRHHHHHQLLAPTLGDVTPRCPRAAAFGHVSVHRSIPGCPSLIFVCSCSPEICKTAGRWVHSPARGGWTHAGGEGRKGDPSPKKCQAPGASSLPTSAGVRSQHESCVQLNHNTRCAAVTHAMKKGVAEAVRTVCAQSCWWGTEKGHHIASGDTQRCPDKHPPAGTTRGTTPTTGLEEKPSKFSFPNHS